MTTPRLPTKRAKPQRGAAAIVLVLLVLLGLVTLLTFRLDRRQPELDADKKTAMALAQAKEALLGLAASDNNRPGSLPCGDINDDGDITIGVDSSCAADLVTRLPWKRLDLPDLRDGNGERLWYAISPDFRSFLSSALNTSAVGKITIRETSGAIIYDAAASTGVVAVIISPGRPLTRQGATSPQDRSCTGGSGCSTALTCQAPYQSVGKCNPVNYMDVVAAYDDNAGFSSATSSDGFMFGPALDANGLVIMNDRIAVITKQELFSVVTFRMAREFAKGFPYTVPPSQKIDDIPDPSKPAVWNLNKWDEVIDGDGTTSYVTSGQIVLKYQGCNITYTITSANNVQRSGSSC